MSTNLILCGTPLLGFFFTPADLLEKAAIGTTFPHSQNASRPVAIGDAFQRRRAWQLMGVKNKPNGLETNVQQEWT